MDAYILPATTYEPPPREVRKHVLNTIIEDEYSEDEAVEFGPQRGELEVRGRTRTSGSTRSIESTSPVPSLTSSNSSYYRMHRRSQDYDDLYDISDDDSDLGQDIRASMFPQVGIARSISPSSSTDSRTDTKKVPSLIIPSPGFWPTIQKLQGGSPPLPPKIPISPAVLSLLPRDQPAPSYLPSLDDSSSSDPQICSTAPTTPDMQVHPHGEDMWGNAGKRKLVQSTATVFELEEATTPGLELGEDEAARWYTEENFDDGTIIRDFGFGEDMPAPDSPVLGSDSGCSDSGVQLPPQAMATLQHLSLEIPEKPDIEDEQPVSEMQEVAVRPPRPNSVDFTPVSHSSEYSLSDLSIPSPGGFFSSLGNNARHTWCLGTDRDVVPPSSTTAENFYNCPWNSDPRHTVERIVEFDNADTEGPPTARQPPLKSASTAHFECEPKNSPLAEVADETKDYDEDYEKTIKVVANNTLDRTSLWLAAQTSYMSALRETNPVNEVGGSPVRRPSMHGRMDTMGSPLRKAVRFLGSEATQCQSPTTAKVQSDSIFYHAFQHIVRDSSEEDAFRHRRTRSDSLQAARIAMPETHIEQLQGNHHIIEADRPTPLRPVSMFPGKDQEAGEQTTEQKVFAQVERERQALEQVTAATWVIEAQKFLNGGSLLHSPATKALKCAAFHMKEDIASDEFVRVLDIGGQPNCDWAWHCSQEYTNVKVYTATTETQAPSPPIRGPSNVRRTPVSNLWQLPYPDNYFTVISARSLFIHLKTAAEDEYDLCLRECLRCLKPGGYIEFFLLDSEIVNAGPLGTAASVEFGFNLKTRGYDPSPTKSWLGRVRRAGFDDIKRAWTFLPMGAPQRDAYVPPETPPPDVSTHDGKGMEAVQGPVGSTGDAASMSCLVGSWAWEQWMLKVQMEMGKENLLEGVASVLEEGKSTGAGWRCLSGWARKPML